VFNRAPEEHLVLLGDGGELLAGMTTYSMSVAAEAPWRADSRAGRGRPAADQAWLSSALMPSRLAGGRHVGPPSALFADSLSGAERGRALERLLVAATEVAARQGDRSVSILFADSTDRILTGVVEELGFARFQGPVRSTLDVPADGLEGYFALFPSKRRIKLRGERRKVAEAGIEFSVQRLDNELAGRLVPLESQNLRRYGRATTPEQAAASHLLIERILPGSAHALVAERAGKPVSFIEFHVWGDHLYTRTGGADYAAIEGIPVYFSMVFYELVEHAARSGARRIDYGVEAARAKALRGCAQTPLVHFVKALVEGDQRRLVELAASEVGEDTAPDVAG